jgi:hypothetical protein
MSDRPTMIRYHALTWLSLAAALAYLCRNTVGVAESTIREDLGLTLEQSGWFMGAFFWTYAIFQVPSGWFAERLGTRIALSIFAVGWSVATLAVGVAPGFWLLIAAQLMMGVAQAGIFPAACNSIGHWMPLAGRSLACGILAAGMQIGAITASGLTGELMAPLGWRWVFVAFAVPGILWTIGFFLWFRDQPTQVAAVNASELERIRSERHVEESNQQSGHRAQSRHVAIMRSADLPSRGLHVLRQLVSNVPTGNAWRFHRRIRIPAGTDPCGDAHRRSRRGDADGLDLATNEKPAAQSQWSRRVCSGNLFTADSGGLVRPKSDSCGDPAGTGGVVRGAGGPLCDCGHDRHWRVQRATGIWDDEHVRQPRGRRLPGSRREVISVDCELERGPVVVRFRLSCRGNLLGICEPAAQHLRRLNRRCREPTQSS